MNRSFRLCLSTLSLAAAVVAAIAVFSGCTDSSDSEDVINRGVIRHPTAESIPDADQVAHVISEAGPVDEEARSLIDRLSRSAEVLVVGVLEGELHEMFGQIEDLAADTEGNLYVLDAGNAVVRVFDSQGEYVRHYGAPGEGPGEFRAPSALEIDRTNRLLVADRIQRITAFSRENADVGTTMTLQDSPYDLCVSATRMYIHATGSEHGGVVHALDTAGAYLDSFGSGYRFGGDMAREDLSRGSLTCSQHTDDVLFALRYVPVLHRYSSQGEIEWTLSLSDFNPMHITEDASTHMLTYSGNEGVSDVMHHLTVIDETDYVLVQVLRRTPESIQERKEYAEILTYVVHLETGAGGYVGNELPPVYAVVAGRLYAAVNWPYPHVLVYELPPVIRPGV